MKHSSPAAKDTSMRADITRLKATLALLLGMLVVVLVPFLANSSFYYDDDVRHYFMPQVMDVGLRLAKGEMPWITLRSWFAGDYVGEGVLSLFNPINLALYWLGARSGDPELAALVFAGAYLHLTAFGVYALARNYGVERSWSVVAALAYCTSSFAMYWWASTWWNALAGVCWMTWAWTAWRSFVRESRYGLLAFSATYFLLVSGWPHGVIMGALIVLVEMVAARGRFILPGRTLVLAGRRMPAPAIGRLAAVLLLAACAAGASMLSNYPALLHAGESARSAWGLSGGHNWVGSLDYLIAAGWPSFLGSSTVFFGLEPQFPSFYLAWFVPPALMLLLYRPYRTFARPLFPLLIIGALSVLLSFGPQQSFFLRWPLRFLTFGHIALAIAACHVLPRLALCAPPDRATWSGYLALGLIISYLADPEYWPIHVALAAIVALGWMMLGSKPPGHTLRALAAAAFLLLVHFTIHAAWPRNPTVGEWAVPQHAYVREPESFTGDSRVVLVRHSLACHEGACPLATGNIGLWEAGRALNGYSPTGARPYHSVLGFDLWSHTDPMSLESLALRAYFSRDPGTGKARHELMRINEFRVGGAAMQKQFAAMLGDDWLVEPLHQGTVFRAPSPPSRLPGTVSWTSPGVQVQGGPPSSKEERLLVRNGSSDGRIIFARAWYPGYEAHIDGQPLRVAPYADFLVSVQLPPGADGTLVLRFLPPGIRWTAPLAATCLLLALGISMTARRRAWSTAA
jgi:hypothetical protein